VLSIVKSQGSGLIWCPEGQKWAKRGAGYSICGIAEVRVVEDIEELGPKLQIHPLRDLRILRNREISVHKVGPGSESRFALPGWQLPGIIG
jgi:hypothetical protein